MSFFRDTSISNKILVPPVIMVVALGAVLLIAIHGFNKQSSVLIQVHDIALERTTLVNEFISLSESVQSDLFRIAVLRYMNLPDKEIHPIYEHLEQGLSNLGVIYGHILNKWLLDQKEKKILEQMRVPMDAFSHEAQQAAAVVSQNPSFGILLVRSAALPFAAFRRLLKEFLNYQKEKIVRAETISNRTVDTVKTTATAIALFTAFMAILITVWIGTRLISRPVRSITEVMDQLASGDLSAKVADLRRRDEIGAMAKAVDVFRKNAIEKQAAEEALRKERDRAQMYLDIAGVMFVAIDTDGKVTLINKKGREILGYDEGEIVGRNWFQNFLPERIRAEVIPVSKKLLSGEIEAAEYNENPILTSRGQERLIAWHNSVLRDGGGNIVGHLSSGEDITEHKQIEETLRESEGKYRSLLDDVVDSSEVGLFILDSDFMIVWVNQALERYFGLQREEIVGKDKRRLIQEHIRHKFEDPGAFAQKVLATYDNNTYVENFECHMLPDGERIDRWLEHWSRPIRSGLYAGGRVELYYDITERKLAEEQVKASLEEKEVLLREIHHRVKNNMQVITSLLRLQSNKIKDQQYAEMLKESQERIKSMALIHEKLYQSKDLARVDFSEYIKSLMSGLFRSHGIDPNRIITKLNIEDVSLGLDHAIPCGLIINELVSNSLKYAFPEDRKGEISVTLRSITEDEIELRVSDDGIGIPEDLDIRNTDSLGLDLVTILAEDQLEGKIDFDRTRGTTFRILFKEQI